MEAAPCLSPEQRRALAVLTGLPVLGPFYLAGGTAVAVHLRHRESLDLDLFSCTADVSLDRVRDGLIEGLKGVEVVAETDASLSLRFGSTAIDVVRFPYPPLLPLEPGPAGMRVASLLDLAVMKLAAISRRGIRRDFWDLYEIAARGGIELSRALPAYTERFGVERSDLYHVLRSLTYFDDAETEPVYPRGLTEAHWRTIQEYFRREAPALLRRWCAE